MVASWTRTVAFGVALVTVLSLEGCSGAATSPTPSVNAVPTAATMATPSASPPSSRTTAPSQATSASADAKTVTAIATGYEEALWSGDPATAWALLAPGPFRPETYAAFARTAAPWRTSPYRRFVVSPATNDPAALATWIDASLAADLALRADRSRAYVVFVQHPDVVGASAGGETLVVAPLVAGDWRIWRAH